MRIAIMGSGGVGGYLGARLQDGGNDVTFIARGAHLDAMRSGGLRIVSDSGTLELPKVTATDDPASVGPVDVVVFTVKLYDMEAAARAVRPMVGEDTVVIPFLNGVEAPAALKAALGEQAAAGGVARIGAAIESPGVIKHTSGFAEFMFGPFHPTQTDVLSDFRDILVGARVDAQLIEDVTTEIWKKMVFLSTFSAITALSRLPAWGFQRHDGLGGLFRQGLEEGVAVARALGVSLPEGVAKRFWTFCSGMPPGMSSSMHHDLENGRRLELPWLSGALARLGEEHGVPTPVHAFATAVLEPWVDGRPDN